MSARSWTAPALWRFENVREIERGQSSLVHFPGSEAKAVEVNRNPRRRRDCPRTYGAGVVAGVTGIPTTRDSN